MGNRWITLGAINCFLGVLIGAFGAHGLKDRLSESGMDIYRTGVTYQMWHGLALLLYGIWANQRGQDSVWVGSAFSLGILLFSGSLYILALSQVRAWGIVTPFGGILFLLAWGSWIWTLLRARAA